MMNSPFATGLFLFCNSELDESDGVQVHFNIALDLVRKGDDCTIRRAASVDATNVINHPKYSINNPAFGTPPEARSFTSPLVIRISRSALSCPLSDNHESTARKKLKTRARDHKS
jgi:hypothetical protein